MPQPQNTTTIKTIPNKPFSFSLKIAGKVIRRPEQSEPVIAVYCDMCSDSAEQRRSELLKSGWGIYKNSAFCPYHERMV